jgi:hypothetical protein
MLRMLEEKPTRSPRPSSRPPGRSHRSPSSAGLVAATAVLASLAGFVLWLHLLSGPIQLATGLMDASDHLDRAAAKLGNGNTKAAQFEALAGSAGASRARAALESTAPLLDVLEAAPVVGPALGEVDHLVAASEHSAAAARGSIDIAANALEGPDSIIERSKAGSRIKIDRVEEIGREIATLREEVAAARSELSEVDLANLPRRAERSIDKAMRKADDAEKALKDADAAFAILPSILGADGERNYLIGFQNTAEARGTGGAILQFKVMNMQDGDIKLLNDTGGTIYEVDQERQLISIPLPEDAWYQANIPDSNRFGNANWSPDFPLTAELLLDYAYASGAGLPPIDGVIAVDPKAVEGLVPATGPIKVPDALTGEKLILEKDEIVDYVLNEQYARYPNPKPRRKHLQGLVTAFYKDIFDPKSPTKLLDGFSTALGEKRVQIWMKEEREQRFIKDMGWDGAFIKAEIADYLYTVEQNVGGNKLDFFDTQEDSIEIEIDGRDAVTSARFAITNRVLMPQPRWVMGDSGAISDPIHRPMLVLYTRPDSELIDASVTGEGVRVDTPPPAAWPSGLPPAYAERGKKAWPVTMEADPGETVEANFEYRVPGIVRTKNGRSVYRLVVQHQPKVRPEWMDIRLQLPNGASDVKLEGWKKDGSGGIFWAGQLNEDMTLEVSWQD